MVKADFVRLCLSIPHDAGQEALRKALDDGLDKKISTDDLAKMTEFVLKNKYFEFNGKVKKKFQGLLLVKNLRLHAHLYL